MINIGTMFISLTLEYMYKSIRKQNAG